MDSLIPKDITSVVPRHMKRLEERVAKLLKRLQLRALRSSLICLILQLQLQFIVYESASTIFRCEHWFISLSLSLLASIAYLILLSLITIRYLRKEAILARINSILTRRSSVRRNVHIVCSLVFAALAVASAVVTAWTSHSVLCCCL